MKPILAGSLIGLLAVIGYYPSLSGTLVWDDDSWTTNITGLLDNARGLGQMWLNLGALQQYYPLTGTSFWLDYQFWNFWTTPYHVENLLLHLLAAWLFWRLLLQLRAPGAGLASALFALHPVAVESVAWITLQPMTNQATTTELLALNQKLLNAIARTDSAAYQELCHSDLTCFEPESRGQLVEGMAFHKFYFDLGTNGRPVHNTMASPQVRMLGDNAALIAYVRLIQRSAPQRAEDHGC